MTNLFLEVKIESMGLFGGSNKEEQVTVIAKLEQILTEIEKIKKDQRFLFERLESRINDSMDKQIQLSYYAINQLDGIFKEIMNLHNELRDLKDLMKDENSKVIVKLDDISTTDTRHFETLLKRIEKIESRFSTLLSVIADILEKELSIAREKVLEELSKTNE